MNFERMTLEVRDRVAYLHLNRPEANNAVDERFAIELRAAALSLHTREDVGAILLTAGGKNFCVGGDLRAFSEMPIAARTPKARAITIDLHGGVTTLLEVGAPVIAAVQGAAAGAGLSLACAADITIAAENSKFAVAYTGVGLVPDTGASYFLPRLVGYKRALDMALTNRVVPAAEALAMGLVSRVVAPEKLLEEATALAKQIAAGPPQAMRGTKLLLRQSTENTLETQLENESRAFSRALGSAEANEGMNAFLEKRKPNFGGLKS